MRLLLGRIGSLNFESKESDTGVYGFTISVPRKKIETKKLNSKNLKALNETYEFYNAISIYLKLICI
jgi:hypothetical protein